MWFVGPVFAVAYASLAAISPQATVSILVVEARTGAPLPGVQVRIRLDAAIGAPTRDGLTDASGYVQFPVVAPGRHEVTVSLIGFAFARRAIEVPGTGSVTITVPLTEGTGTYQEEVVVSAATAPAAEVGVSSQVAVSGAVIQDLRGIGTDDALRAVQALPGVATGDDFQAEFSVRGSAFRHVGLVIDGVPAPLLLHAVRGRDDTGSLAMINADVVDRVTLSAGPHPQRRGDWLGATVAFDLREGSRDRARARGMISGTSASAVAEGPLGTRASWLVTARKSYIDWVVRKLDPEIESTIGFTDAQAKVAGDAGDRHRIELLLIGGEAVYREPEVSLSNGLARATSTGGLAAVTWRYTGGRTTATQRFAATTSRFDNTGMVRQSLGRGRTTMLLWRGDAAHALGKGVAVEGGLGIEAMRLDERRSRYAASGPQSVRLTRERQLEGRRTLRSAWAHVAWRTEGAGLAAGARVVDATDRSGRWVAPWILGEVSMGRVTARLGAGRSAQPPPLEAELASPEVHGRERASGVDASIAVAGPAGLRWQVTAFWRQEHDRVRLLGEERLDNGVRIPQSVFPIAATRLSSRVGGVEAQVARVAGPATPGLTGWIAYTWAHAEDSDAVTRESFDGDFDQRHTINAFVQQRLSARTAVNARFRAGSNMPLVGYFGGTIDAPTLGAERNRVRLPWYVRLDLRASRVLHTGRRRATLFAEIINALGRRNLGQADGFFTTTLQGRFFTEKLIPRIPSAGVVIEF